MYSEWRTGLFGCFDDLGLCIITYFVPCYTFGKNAEAMGDSCLCCALTYMFPIVHLVAAVSIRGRIRSEKNIGGNTCGDFITVLFCPFCALVQEAFEIRDPLIGQMMARE